MQAGLRGKGGCSPGRAEAHMGCGPEVWEKWAVELGLCSAVLLRALSVQAGGGLQIPGQHRSLRPQAPPRARGGMGGVLCARGTFPEPAGRSWTQG